MTRKMTAAERAHRCGPYKVTRRGRRVYVRCPSCGTSSLPLASAVKLAAWLEGPLGRFAIKTTRERRLALAAMLRTAARKGRRA